MPDQDDQAYVEILEFTTASAEQQDRLIEAVGRETAGWVSTSPGFVRAVLHKSTDGERVVNRAEWRSRNDYERFTKDDRIGRLKSAIEDSGASQSGSRGFVVAAVVEANR